MRSANLLTKEMKMNRRTAFIASLLIVLCLTASLTWAVEVRTNVRIPMGDGVDLSANIFLPESKGEFPVILMRSPYGKGDDKFGEGLHYAGDNYVYVSQDCRGKGQSDGDWDPFANEITDGKDTHQWVLAQEWCNGKIATTGGSYVGFTQWTAAAGAGDYLKAMFPAVPLVDPYHDCAYTGGAFNLALLMGWGTGVSYKPGDKLTTAGWKQDDWLNAYKMLPLNKWDTAVNKDIPYLRQWVAHTQFDSYWQTRTTSTRLDEITVPVFAVGGWYDIFAKSTIDHVNTVRKTSKSPLARKHAHVLMGPWTHGISWDGKVGELNFGKQSLINLGDIQKKWFDRWLKDEENGVEEWAPFRIFVMGENKWRDENEWPLARTVYTPYYLHSKGSANTLRGDGTLNTQKPKGESKDTFEYDPHNPVPTLGGCNLVNCPAGPYDQTKAQQRQDVLVFTSEKLTEPVEVTGPVKVILYAASSAPDTDWTAKLVDVHPDGTPYNLCDGIIRAQFRESMNTPSTIEPGKVYRYEIDLWVTSNVFLKDHKIRVEISSSNFPRFDRNPNSGLPFGTDTKLNKASQTIYHNARHPSHILLPVIP